MLALLVYAFNAIMYFIAEFTVPARAILTMEIDNQIPFISYFFIFYLLYYPLPPLFLWILSFYDKKKVQGLSLAGFFSVLVCFICYVSYQIEVSWDRYAIVAEYKDFSTVTNLDTFLRWGLNIQYGSDPKGVNTLPSLHAVFGAMLFCIGFPFFKSDKHYPLWQRIFCMFFGVGIVMSTFFIKQHYFIDAVVGMALYIASYIAAHFIMTHFLKKKNYVFIDNHDKEKEPKQSLENA